MSETIVRHLGLSPFQVQHAKEVFEACDTNKDGLLTFEEVGQLLRSLGYCPSIPELYAFIKSLDYDGDSAIIFDEFLQTYSRNMVPLVVPTEHLKATFTKCDKFNSGKISTSDLERVLRAIGLQPTKETLAEMVVIAHGEESRIEDLRTENIDFEEFSAAILGAANTVLQRELMKGTEIWTKLRHALSFVSLYCQPRIQDSVKLTITNFGRQHKEVLFFRHGESQANEAFRIHRRDTYIWDPMLTTLGVKQALDAGDALNSSGLDFDLIVVSPLRRSIETARLTLAKFIEKGVKVIVQPDATERVTASDDLGASPKILRQDYPEADWSLMPDKDVWWWHPESHKHATSIEQQRQLFKDQLWEEPWKCVFKRAANLQRWLATRPEQRICIVAHGNLIEACTGRQLANAQSLRTAVYV